jgi:hypothetical protein
MMGAVMTTTDAAPPRWISKALPEATRALIRDAARCQVLVWQLYPGPVAALIAETLSSYAEFGHRFDQSGQVAPLVAHILGCAASDSKKD